MGKLVSNSQFWYGDYDYGLKLANFTDSPFKGGCPSSDKSNLCRPPNLGGLCFDEAMDTKIDNVSVISIKKGSIWAQLADFVDSPFNNHFVATCTEYGLLLTYFNVEEA